MAYTVYFTAAETNCPTQEVAKEYLKALGSVYGRVGVFRSFTNGPIEEDAAFLGLLQSIGRREDAERAWGTTRASYVVDEENAMNAILRRYSDYARDFD
ncbi:MAG: phosphate acetyltransferase, partial [Peptidiphaga gingivicola]